MKFNTYIIRTNITLLRRKTYERKYTAVKIWVCLCCCACFLLLASNNFIVFLSWLILISSRALTARRSKWKAFPAIIIVPYANWSNTEHWDRTLRVLNIVLLSYSGRYLPLLGHTKQKTGARRWWLGTWCFVLCSLLTWLIVNNGRIWESGAE